MSSSPTQNTSIKEVPDEDMKPQADSEENAARKRKAPDDSSATASEQDESEPSAQDDDEKKEPPKDGKNWKRIMANRKSARESRIRRIKYMETLEKSVEELTKENTALLRENQAIARENFALRQQVASLLDPSGAGDSTSFRQPVLPMGPRGTFSPTRQGLLPPDGRMSGGSMGMPFHGAASLAAARSSLTRPVLDIARPGMDMPPSGLRDLPPMLPPGPHDDQLLEMMRRRRPPLPPPSAEEDGRLLQDILRRRRQL